ncbi:MAG: hypothetical protein HON14_08840 [Rhodospirillaceae bacterium]|jgi:catechol 2,3-dioxygenase-like lactoylglutathione lyase family enzyme|nr:hypothetical protein [Rhodospirillaceae bacterium]MBT4589686.1 hypothetical protein [Rhodospirillaceae bacterium]MBT4939223.1 hypothetical protein [Rhodospirillaceae bacterium]MBT7267911.1 hypothetical protein [Rhodospirillaceae bacterium]
MIKVKDVAFPRFRAPDLDKMESYLEDFGMVRSARTEDKLFMRGLDASHHIHVTELGESKFIGAAYWADSLEDLEKLASSNDASDVEDINEPGGGQRVCLTDPDGFQIEVVYGIEEIDPLPATESTGYNWVNDRRRLGDLKRVGKGPSPVKRFAHYVIGVTDYEKTQAFYADHLGLIPSDTIHDNDDESRNVMTFNRVDQGDEFVDHHTFAAIECSIFGSDEAMFHHVAFEVEDLDTLVAGHEYLMSKDYEHAYGIGRHILGSQIFDYWQDPFGFRHEHWTDSDLLNASSPTGHHPVSTALSVQWGPTIPRKVG